jgi:hypothetical protein
MSITAVANPGPTSLNYRKQGDGACPVSTQIRSLTYWFTRF